MKLLDSYLPPVAIGGIGGSGTRLIAQCLNELGFFIGSDLNEAYDNLYFTLLFKRIEILSASNDEFDELVNIFLTGMGNNVSFTASQIDLINELASHDRTLHSADWLKERAYALLTTKNTLSPSSRWGWKEPNTHIIIDRLNARFNKMKYIHVVRNGLDMAYSHNQGQPTLWGEYFTHQHPNLSPAYSLKYWCVVHRRILNLCKPMGAHFLLLNYDDFCLNPKHGIKTLATFLEVNITPEQQHNLIGLIRPPESIGRFKQYDMRIFDEDDIKFVAQLGFDINKKSYHQRILNSLRTLLKKS